MRVSRSRGSGVLATLGVALILLTACTSGSGHPAASSTPSASSSSGSASGTAGPGPAWTSVLSQVKPDGSVDTQTALTAFALAFGPLPGVNVPSGDPGVLPDATGPLRWLSASWDHITPEQQAAAAKLVPGMLPAPTAASTPSPAGLEGSTRVVVRNADLDLIQPVEFPTDDALTKQANDIAAELGKKVGPSLGIPITVVRNGSSSKYFGISGVFAADGTKNGTKPAKCIIGISLKGDALTGDDLKLVLYHEVWHCFQGQVLGLGAFWSTATPQWIVEGEAEWVGIQSVPDAAIASDFWDDYLENPGTSLFARTYSAKGFYAQLDASGDDVWHALIPMMQEPSSAKAFDVAGGTADHFLNVWASNLVRDSTRGNAWDLVAPGITDNSAPLVSLTTDVDSPAPASVKAYTNGLYKVFTGSSEVVDYAFAGHARVSDSSGHDYLVQQDALFCVKQGGECTCPDTTEEGPTTLPLDASKEWLALSGDPGGDSGSVVGKSMDELCRLDVTGTWKGTYNNGIQTYPITFKLTQKGSTVTGTVSYLFYTCLGEGPALVTYQIKGSVNKHKVTLTQVVHGVDTITITATVKNKTMTAGPGDVGCGGGAHGTVTKVS